MNNVEMKFSDKVKHLEASAIREIFKLLAKPGIISFAGGAPDPDLFPKEELAEISADVLKNQGNVALQYGVTEGYAPLRNWVIDRLSGQGIISDKDEILDILQKELTYASILNENLLCQK